MNRINKILLVDDDSDDRFIFSEVIKRIGKKVECTYVTDGESALKVLGDNSSPTPDIIFLDLNMPRMSGAECLIRLRKIDGLKHVPVIILTTSDQPEDISAAVANGASYFLTKSTFKELIDCISFLMFDPDEKQNIPPEKMSFLNKKLKKLND